MVSWPQLPASGSWKTRATRAERRAVDWRVTSTPSMTMRPALGGTSPAIAERSVDLPAPFEPMTLTNSPASIGEVDAVERALLERRAAGRR